MKDILKTPVSKIKFIHMGTFKVYVNPEEPYNDVFNQELYINPDVSVGDFLKKYPWGRPSAPEYILIVFKDGTEIGINPKTGEIF